MIKSILTCLVLVSLSACDTTDSGSEEPDLSEKPKGSDVTIPIYNQAYQENYESDKISDIVANAAGAYVLIDPFQDGVATSIPNIKIKNNQVGCYISIGTGEDWRPDFTALQPFLATTQWGEWPGEYFVSDVLGVLPIMKARIDSMATWGCDWVEFDNMDWSADDDNRSTYNLDVTHAEGIAFYIELADYVHQKGMKAMAKNTFEGATGFDGILYESYDVEKNWWDIAEIPLMLAEEKLVIINHYNESRCNAVYQDYLDIYGNGISYICEDKDEFKYIHYNE